MPIVPRFSFNHFALVKLNCHNAWFLLLTTIGTSLEKQPYTADGCQRQKFIYEDPTELYDTTYNFKVCLKLFHNPIWQYRIILSCFAILMIVMAAENVKMFGGKKWLRLKCRRPNDSNFQIGIGRVGLFFQTGLEASMKNLAKIPEPRARLGSTSVVKITVLCTKLLLKVCLSDQVWINVEK